MPVLPPKHPNQIRRKNGRQRYKCSVCHKFLPTPKPLDNNRLLYEYINLKQTCAQIAKRYQCSAKTVRRRIKQGSLTADKPLKPVANVIMDTTYFGRSFGVMVFMNQLDGSIIHKQYLIKETAALYAAGLTAIMKKGIHIQSITADGFKGIAQLFPEIPFQLCQFHQQQTIRRYLTRKPKSDAARALKKLADSIFILSEAEFKAQLTDWYDTHKNYLNEVGFNEDSTQKWYTHKKLRSAYSSLKRNLPYLFTFEQNRELGMPNTTNMLEGRFGELKTKKRCHSGMNDETKRLFIDNLFGV